MKFSPSKKIHFNSNNYLNSKNVITKYSIIPYICRSVVKNSPEIVRSSLLPFFNNAADDLAQVVDNLVRGRFSHVKGTIVRGATSLDSVHMVLLPVLSSMFDHLGRNKFGAELIGMYAWIYQQGLLFMTQKWNSFASSF